MYKVSRTRDTITETWYFANLHAYEVSHRHDLALTDEPIRARIISMSGFGNALIGTKQLFFFICVRNYVQALLSTFPEHPIFSQQKTENLPSLIQMMKQKKMERAIGVNTMKPKNW